MLLAKKLGVRGTHSLLFASSLFLIAAGAACASTPPVRLSIVAANHSGDEQDVVDRLTAQLERMPNVSLSTVNPDWYVKCAIEEVNDRRSGQIRYNGTVTVTTTDGQLVSTTSVQKYNQDFSLEGGAPLNKALVQQASRQCVEEISAKAIDPIDDAVQTEIGTRERVISASKLADQHKYDQAIVLLQQILPDSPHFKQARTLMLRYQRLKGGGHG